MKHQPDDRAKPTLDPSTAVIHDEYADETQLARWLRRGMEKGPKFWGLVAATVALATAVFYLVNGLSQGDPAAPGPGRRSPRRRTPTIG